MEHILGCAVASPEAKFCVCNRFVADIRKYPTLKWVVIFGEAGWEAINLLKVGCARAVVVPFGT
jgi:hypothetical protein